MSGYEGYDVKFPLLIAYNTSYIGNFVSANMLSKSWCSR